MEILKKIKNNQRGSVTVFVLATMLIVVGIVVTIYMTTINKNNTQMAQIEKIKEEYLSASGYEQMEEAYRDLTNQSINNVIYNYLENGGESVSKDTETVQEGQKVDLSVTATKAGYDFVGWNTDKNATSGMDEVIMGKEDITLYAIYSKNIKGTFYYWDGYSMAQNVVNAKLVNNQTQVNIITPNISSVYSNGKTYNPRGWSRNNIANSSIDVYSGSTLNISDNVTYYALYENSITISYSLSGISGTAPESQSTTVYMNSRGETSGNGKITIAAKPNVSRNGFVCWNTNYSGTGQNYLASQTITPNNSMTLYAVWYNITTPASVGAYTGEKLTIYCSINNTDDVASCKVYKSGNQTDAGVEVKNATITKTSGGISMIIDSLSASDEGYYYFVITTKTYGDIKIESGRTFLDVL